MEIKGKASVEEFLRKHPRIGIDTSIFIYWIEANPVYTEMVEPVFRWLDRPQSSAVTSSLTMLELLVKPYQETRLDLVYEFFALLSTYSTLLFLDLNITVANQAAKVRAETRLKTPDAIQAASAILFGASGFIGNDPSFKRVPGLEVFILRDYMR